MNTIQRYRSVIFISEIDLDCIDWILRSSRDVQIRDSVSVNGGLC